MIIIIELVALAVCLFLTRHKVKKVIKISPKSLAWGVLFGVFYCVVIFLLKRTELGASVFFQFVSSIGLQFSIVYTIYPFVIAISEEFIFRYFAANYGGTLLASILFTILHWRPDFPTPLFVLIFLLGLSQSWLLKKTNSIWSPIIAHLMITYFLLIGI